MCKVLLCIGYIPDSTEMIFVYICRYSVVAVADPEGGGGGGGGVRGFNPPLQRLFFFFACQYMKIPTDVEPKRRILAQNPPPLKNS